VARPAVICALPREEAGPVVQELANAGLDVIRIQDADELEAVLRARRDVGLAIIDGESDFDASLELYSMLHDGGRNVPALMVVSPRTMERLGTRATASNADEYFTRPYSAESLRWRVEAMLIRAQTYDDGSGEILRSPDGMGEWGKRALIVALFNPKGGVGKTTIATNLAASLQIQHRQRVLLIDADPVSGHIATSLGLDRVQSVADAWDEEGDAGPTLPELAAAHDNGIKVIVLSSNPLHSNKVDPVRFADGLAACRPGFDVVLLDLHPDYGELNQTIFERCDRILVPVTPDVPAIRAALQFVELSRELGVRERIAMVVNRANSGVSVADMEKATGLKAFGQIRSGGLLFVRAANEGATVVEKFPKEKVAIDFDALASSLLMRDAPQAAADKGLLRMFQRPREAVRA
jgi:pilus assembly protein CpaE